MAKSKATTKLTAKQELFAKLIAIDGLNQSDAYRRAYNCENMSDSSVWCNAAKLAADAKVMPRIEQLKAKVEDKCIWTKEEMIRDLLSIKNEMMEKKENAGLTHQERNTAIKAIERAAKMLGYDAPEKVEMSGSIGVKQLLEQLNGEDF